MAMAMAGLYTKLTLGGVNCLLWLPSTTTNTTKDSEKRRLKKRKQELRTTNLETPILDQKMRNSHANYCDAIIQSDHLDKWASGSAIRNSFAHSTIITNNSTNGNKKLVIRNRENTEYQLVIHFYVTTSNLMVQPGNFSEKSLLDFIKLIPRLRPLPSNSDVWESERQPLPVSSDDYKLPLQVNLPPLDHAHTVSIANKSDSLECCRHTGN